jgi:predicted transcriptional regulator
MAVEGDTSDGTASVATTEEPSVDRDDVFDVLSNPRRRYALHLLGREDRELQLGEVAEHVAAWENGTDVDAVGSDERKHAYTALQQRHLPRMDDVGVVEFDRRAGTVAPTPAIDEFDIYLEVVGERDVPWSEYYLGVGVLAVAVVGAAHLGAPVVSAVTGLGWATVVSVALLVSAAVHHATTRESRLANTEAPPEIED